MKEIVRESFQNLDYVQGKSDKPPQNWSENTQVLREQVLLQNTLEVKIF